jgi:TonB family protein
MGYQALLFCPDEKNARTVTQVLSELEFNVETCTEPFAAVKKLMSRHFDAVVVDCDNEQNATLLFKSARNSTSNQASLAVAVVEGQAGVAKAFRIGANLVLTKPINIEQAKGTLRVARGLLRKSEPAKVNGAAVAASASAHEAAVSAKSQTSAAAGSISTAPILAPQVHTEPNTRLVASIPSAIPISKAAVHDEDLLGIGDDDYDSSPPGASAAPASGKFITPAPQADKFLAAAVVSQVKAPASAGLPPAVGGGAASAPAPAREREGNHVAEVSPPERPAENTSKKAATGRSESPSLASSAPSFTFSGANAPAESSGGGKKLLLAIVAAVIIAAAAYASWSHFHGKSSQPDNAPTEDTPTTIVTPSPSKPKSAQTSAPKPSASLSGSPAASNEKSHVSDTDSVFDDSNSSSAGSSATESGKNSTTDPAEAPLVVKGGKAPATAHAKAGLADAPAPSMIGIAMPGAGAPPPNFVGSGEIVPKPLLQTLNISQGVSHGLLIKKVQPVYPRNALSSRIEGLVELLATVSKNGDIAHVKVLSGDSQLTKAATDAVKQWKYKPYLLNGEPVEIQTEITINFKLPK